MLIHRYIHAILIELIYKLKRMHIVFDIGGTKTRIARSFDGITYEEPLKFNTRPEFKGGMELFISKIQEVVQGEEVTAIAGGIAGVLNKDKTELIGGPNTKGWWNKPIVKTLEETFRTKVYIENDTVMGGMGEMHHGAGITEGIGVYLTVSTGVGGCRFVDGSPDKSTMGFEPGWQIIDAGGSLCDGCNTPGYLEDYIGGNAMEKRLGVKPYTITEDSFWKEHARLLALGLVNISVLWSPEVIVIGGSMMNKIGIPIPETREFLAEYLSIFPTPPRIEHAKFNDEMGLYGALAYIQKKDT